MSSGSLRRQIAWEAARLLCHRQETQCFRARWKAALRVCGGGLRPADMPHHREIRDEGATLEKSLGRDAFGLPPEQASRDAGEAADRFRLYENLLLPLEQLRENRRTHPEGDVLYHSLQVFELGRCELPYDEEFLLAALLHDVGKALDPKEHVAAALDALDGSITERTAWLIEHHVEALLLHEGTLGVRCRRRLEAAADFQELMLLAECDRRGRVKGVRVPELCEAIDYLRNLAQMTEA